MSVDLAEEYRQAAEAYHLEAQRCQSPDEKIALEKAAKAMEEQYLSLQRAC